MFTPNTRSLRRCPLVGALLLALAPLAAQAATVAVTSPHDTDVADTATCTLRQAVVTMNHGATADAGEGNCRANAVTAPDDFGSNDTLVFAAGAGATITLADAPLNQLQISAAALVIDASGIGGVAIERPLDAANAFGLILDDAPDGASLTLRSLTLRNGFVADATCNGWAGGGAICSVAADVTLVDSVLSGNRARWGGGVYAPHGDVTLVGSAVSGNSLLVAGQDPTGCDCWGGGLYTRDGAISLTDSTVSGNVAPRAGGLFSLFGDVTLLRSAVRDNTATWSYGGGISQRGGDLSLTASTVSGNSAVSDGGGAWAYVYGDAFSSVDVTLVNSTVSGNSANRGGGLYVFAYGGGSLTLTNATLAGNTAATDGGGIHVEAYTARPDFVAPAISVINTILWNAAAGSADLAASEGASLDIHGSANLAHADGIGAGFAFVDETPLSGDPRLLPLGDYGGPTPTQMPGAGSAAIDAGADAACAAAPVGGVDQRGAARPDGAHCDIGAVESDLIFRDGFDGAGE